MCKHHRTFYSYWKCYVQAVTYPGSHFSGTCKMAPESDPQGVVSNTLKVRKVDRLRVIDASIMPSIVTANIMATVYMIAEKGANFIIEDWRS